MILHAVGGLCVTEHAKPDAVDFDDIGRIFLRLRTVDAAIGQPSRFHTVDGNHHAVIIAVKYMVVGQGHKVHARVSHGLHELGRGVEQWVARIGIIAVKADGSFQIGNGIVCRGKRFGDHRVLGIEIIAFPRPCRRFELFFVHHQIAHCTYGGGAGRKGRLRVGVGTGVAVTEGTGVATPADAASVLLRARRVINHFKD